MPRRRSRSADLEDAIETALMPDQFIGSGYDDDFIENEIAKVLHKGGLATGLGFDAPSQCT